jgi:ABC-type branched-subunit amino acid transport system ATPase component
VTPTAGLVVRDLTVRFGGLTAVSGVSLDAPVGRLTGLIGPNGAGKTTTFNACCGLVRPTTGSVHICGEDASDWTPARRARAGLGRSFQGLELYDSLTVAENVRLGREAALTARRPLGQLFSTPRERAEIEREAQAAIDLCGLRHLGDVAAGALSTGERRLVELARALAGPFRLLLLDEPSSGLDSAESMRFGDILQTVMAERELGILLVEHDMALVSRICEYVHVLDFGRPLFRGSMAEVLASDLVVEAYLGSGAGLVEGDDADVAVTANV